MIRKTKTTWRRVKLGEILKIRRGASPRPIHDYITKEGIPWLKIADITAFDSRYVDVTKEFIKKEGVSKSVIVKPGDLILSNSATPGIPRFMKITVCVHDGWLILKPTNNSIDKNFLYYRLLIDRKRLISNVTGAVFDNLKTDILRDHEILLPSMNEQKRIASVLSAFDDKIELNNRISRTLEQMAQAIFKEWFVKFKFPGHEKVKMIDSELGKIPKGWKVRNVLEIIKRIPSGKKYDNKTAFPKGKVPILDQGQSGYIGYHNDKPGVEAGIDKPVVVFTNHTCNYRLVTYPFSAIQNVLPYVGINKYPTLFIYYLTRGRITMQEYKGHWPEFEQQRFIIPPVILAEEFKNTIQSFIERIVKAEKENQKLAALRDLLLPKLMSGEIEV